jgi:hypothetical protein
VTSYAADGARSLRLAPLALDRNAPTVDLLRTR